MREVLEPGGAARGRGQVFEGLLWYRGARGG